MNTPTETLRRAAALMRERAKACQEGFEAEVAPDWYGQPRVVASALRREYGSGGIFDVDAEHIVSWRPAVALTVADWLTVASVDYPENPEALAVARAYLGSDQ